MRTSALVAMCLSVVMSAGLSGRIAAGAEETPAKQLDLTYVTADCYAAVIFHPQQMAKLPAAAPLVKRLEKAEMPAVFNPLHIEQVVVMFPGHAAGDRHANSPAPVFVLRFGKGVNVDAMAADLLRDQGARQLSEARVLGKKCYKFAAPAEEADNGGRPKRREVPPTMTCAADDRTVLLSHEGEDRLQKMLSASAVKSPLVEQLRNVDVGHDVVVVYVVEPVLEQVKQEIERDRKHAHPPMIPLMDTLPLLRHFTVSLDLNDDTLGKIVLQPADAASVAKIESLARLFQQKAKEEIQRERTFFAEHFTAKLPEPIERLFSLGEKLLDAMTVTKTDGGVALSLKPTKGIGPEVLKTFFDFCTRRGGAEKKPSESGPSKDSAKANRLPTTEDKKASPER